LNIEISDQNNNRVIEKESDNPNFNYFETQISKKKKMILINLPVTLIRGLDELHREKELYGADQQATEIEGQGEGA